MEEIGKILPKVLRPQFSRLEPPVIEVLAPLWGQVAGKALAKECRPVAFSEGTLTLATADSEWVVPLRQMRDEIRTHVNGFLGGAVVRHINIECAGVRTHGDGPARGQASNGASEPGNYPRRRPAFSEAEPAGRSPVKPSAGKHGRVH